MLRVDHRRRMRRRELCTGELRSVQGSGHEGAHLSREPGEAVDCRHHRREGRIFKKTPDCCLVCRE